MPKLDVRVENDHLRIGRVTITFHRTLRIPDDGKRYPLPPTLGAFPLRRVEDFKERVPAAWREHGGVFLPMYQREAMWLQFDAQPWRPNAVKVAVGKVNALSGKAWSERLSRGRDGAQDYMVVPDQPWLDGINAGDGLVKQFVAMPLGMGYTVEGQVTGEEKFGGVQLCVFDPKTGRFPDRPPVASRVRRSASLSPTWGGHASGSTSSCFLSPGESVLHSSAAENMGMGSLADSLFHLEADWAGQEMGLGAGGRMKQKVYADPHGVETWDQESYGRVFVHLVNSSLWTTITGEPMPATPVSAQAYAKAGYPWFDLYDEEGTDVASSPVFDEVKSVKEMDEAKGFEGQQDDGSFEVPESAVTKYHVQSGVSVPDGSW